MPDTYLKTRCVNVFALACRYGWDALAKAAAKQSLNLTRLTIVNDSSVTPQLRHISADRFHALLRYHYACGQAASSVDGSPWANHRYSWYLEEMHSVLKDRPRASVKDPLLLVSTQVKAASCDGPCRKDGLRDLVEFVVAKYQPAVNTAIEAVLWEFYYGSELTPDELISPQPPSS
ncbi:hypothetical protein B0H12DRAFT_1080383 [Mycena haematopus]|nr:hypothetical protein B0H12DRAFT_1080383 [Mycena haematopus]